MEKDTHRIEQVIRIRCQEQLVPVWEVKIPTDHFFRAVRIDHNKEQAVPVNPSFPLHPLDYCLLERIEMLEEQGQVTKPTDRETDGRPT